MDMNGGSASPDLGGGMIGALAVCGFTLFVCVDWFSDYGDCHDFDRNDSSYRSLSSRNAEKVDEPDWPLYKEQWLAFIDDMKSVKTNMKSSKKRRRLAKTKAGPQKTANGTRAF